MSIFLIYCMLQSKFILIKRQFHFIWSYWCSRRVDIPEEAYNIQETGKLRYLFLLLMRSPLPRNDPPSVSPSPTTRGPMPRHVRRRLELSALGAVRPFQAVHPCTGLFWRSLLLPDVTLDTSISLSPAVHVLRCLAMLFFENSFLHFSHLLFPSVSDLSPVHALLWLTRAFSDHRTKPHTHLNSFLSVPCILFWWILSPPFDLHLLSHPSILHIPLSCTSGCPPAPASGCSSPPLLHLSYFLNPLVFFKMLYSCWD